MVEDPKYDRPRPVPPLSAEMEEVLEKEIDESEIQAAMDAALEAGITVTRAEIVAVLRRYPKDEKNTSSD